MDTELTDNEKRLLAREIAADRSAGRGSEGTFARKCFNDGWDAALEWVEGQRIENCTKDMEISL